MLKKYFVPQLGKDSYEHRVFGRVVDLTKLTGRLLHPKKKESDMVAERVSVLKDLLKMSKLNVPEIQELSDIVRDTAFHTDPTKIAKVSSSPVEMFPPEFMKEATSAVDELVAVINNHHFFFQKLRRAQEKCVASRKELFCLCLMLALSKIEIRGAMRMQVPGIKEKKIVIGKLLIKEREWKEKHADHVEKYTDLFREELELRQEVEKISDIIEKAVCARIQQRIYETLTGTGRVCHLSIVAEIETEKLAHGIYRATSDTYLVPEPLHPSKARYDPGDSDDMPVAIPNPEFAQIIACTEVQVSPFAQQMFKRPTIEQVEEDMYHTVNKDVPKGFIPGVLKLKAGQVLKQKLVSRDGMLAFGWTRRSRISGKSWGFFPTDVAQKI